MAVLVTVVVFTVYRLGDFSKAMLAPSNHAVGV